MNRLTKLILSFFDLLEAEGRSFRSQTQAVFRGLIILFFAGVFLTAAALMACYGIFISLVCAIGAPAAAAVTTIVLAALGLICLNRGLAQDRRQDDKIAPPEASGEADVKGGSHDEK